MNQNAQDNAAALRARLKQRRAEIPPQDRDRGALLIRGRLYTWLATNRTRLRESGRPDVRGIAAFWPMADEPALQALLRQWAEDETLAVSLPVVAAPGQPLRFLAWTPDTPMKPGAYGILEPEGPEVPPPDVVLVPTLGYTRQGDRLGYGGGYYDRTLAALKAAGHAFTTVGIAWACGDLSGEAYAPAAHDVRLDAVLTDKGWAVPAPEL
ncbi:5-formyltetrahydrofolate cyclo-ligase OS=Castellaniella defragrans (strain DSM / CCUG 39792/ 65Phen) OX=1437824 GN=BN940_02401 PE=3 SV=1 [Castellaniella denitrificans]|uniref:5-formyltetrahydrofolate cyclo-ligase n=1 Tax=Castellaniella sp. TaxID=1955812 RepID=UPI002AFF8A5E|nr:5-formyltetrahydrofolate cyclo-ligase [Castellaniella sp.]